MKKILCLISILFSFSVFAQSGEGDDMGYGLAGDRGVKIGGTISPFVFARKIGSDTLAVSTTTTRLYAGYSFTYVDLYLRGRFTFTKVLAEKTYTGDNQKALLDLDAGYIRVGNSGRTVAVTGGRKFFMLGNGIVLNGRGDGGEFSLDTSLASLRVFGMYTGLLKKDLNPYALSDKDYNDGSKRIFAGGSISKDFFNNQLFAYYLYEKDKTDDENSAYDSIYYSLGAKGIVSDNFIYRAEAILEKGTSADAATGAGDDISAMSAFLSANYLFASALKPTIGLLYFYGSGDSDRSDYTVGSGNYKGKDTAFVTFGYLPIGFALNPSLGNLHIISPSASIKPFGGTSVMKEFSMLARYIYYRKDKKDSTISSASASLDKSTVGHGAEAVLSYAPYADLSFYVVYSFFAPGSAFAAKDPINFVMGGLNLAI